MAKKEVKEKFPSFMASTIEKAICFFGGIFLVLLVGYALSFVTIMGYLISIFIIGIPIVGFLWIPRNICWTMLKENQAKFILFFGANPKTIIAYKGKKLDENGRVVDGTSKHFFGGIRFIGIWPLYTIHVWQFFSWKGVDEEGRSVSHPSEWVDHVNLKNYQYEFKIIDIRDVDQVTLMFDASIYSRIIDPEVAVFKNKNFLNEVLGLLTSEITHFSRQRKNADLNKVEQIVQDREVREAVSDQDIRDQIMGSPQEMGTIFWMILKKRGIIDDIIDNFGAQVFAIKIRNFEPTPDYQEATTLVYRATQEGLAAVERATHEAKRDAQETLGQFMHMLEIRLNLEKEELIKAMKEPDFNEKYSLEIKECNELLKQKLSLDGKALIHIISSSSQGGNTLGTDNNVAIVTGVTALLRTLNMPAVSGQTNQSEKVSQKSKEEIMKKKLKDAGFREEDI